MRSVAVLAAILLANVAARAEARLVHAKVTASSTHAPTDNHEFSPTGGFDEPMTTDWCEGNPKSAAGEWLLVELDHAIPLAEIYAITTRSAHVPQEKGVQVLSFDLEVDGKLVYSGVGIHPMNGATAKTIKVTIRKVDGPADGVACFDRVRLFAPGASRVVYSAYTGELAALESFRRTSAELVGAFAACNAKRLEKVVAFPLARTEWVGADPGGHGGREQVTTIKTAKHLAQLCKAQPKRWGKRGLFGAAELAPEFSGSDRAEVGTVTMTLTDGRWMMSSIR